MRTKLFLLSIVLLAGCESIKPALPEGYAGPTAILKDSAKVISGSKADFYLVERINGNRVNNSQIQTEVANQGHGLSMTPIIVQRPVAAALLHVEIAARTGYAAPIQALVGPIYEIKGPVEFTAEAGKTYVVRGELGQAYSAVWIEEESTGALVGKKFEIKGSAKLGILN
jgi:hypothetical protein